MVVRLAFAVAINVDPEILLVDEALAVGDIYFRQRCMRKVHELRARGITILFVSHAVARREGHRRPRPVAGSRPHGRARRARPVIAKYLAAMVEKDSAYLQLKPAARSRAAPPRAAVRAPEVVETIPNIDHRYGDGRAEVIGIAVLDEQGEPLAPAGAVARASWCASACAPTTMCPCPSSDSCCATSWASISPAPTPRAKATIWPAMQAGRHLHRGFPSRPAGAVSGVVFLFAGHRRRHAGGLHHVRLDR